MSRQDPFQLDESLDAGDFSRAWLVWSGAVEAALADSYRFSGGALPGRGLVLGRESASFWVVRLGGHKVRKARGNAADAQDAAEIILHRDSSIAPLLDMRRRFKAVMDVLDAMIRNGISLSRSVELTSQWDRILAIGPVYPVLLLILMFVGVLVLVSFFVLLLMFIVVLVISSMRLLFIDGMGLLGFGGVGFGRIPWCIPIDGFAQIWFPLHPFYSVSHSSRLVVLGCLLLLLVLMRNFERPGFAYFCRSGQRDTSLEEFDCEVEEWLLLDA